MISRTSYDGTILPGSSHDPTIDAVWRGKQKGVSSKTDAGWYDYWTGKHEAGGRWIEAAAPIEHSPLYVKAGSIIPFAVCQQFTGEQPDAPYTIKIYPGADADFEIYEDAGDGYAYEKKAFATYRLHWNDKAKPWKFQREWEVTGIW